MKVEEFAAKRRATLTVADDALRPVVTAALGDFGADEWFAPIVDAAAQLWMENFHAEAPGAKSAAALAAFRRDLAKSLAKTADPGGVPTPGKVERVTRWAATFTVNSATIRGAYSAGVRGKMWVTMHDSSVRELHDDMDGVVRPIGGVFNVGGAKLAYPGEPVGPPEGWIECRCVAMPAARPGETMSTNTFALDQGVDIPEDEDMADDIEEEWTSATVMLIPSTGDPIVAASSEIAHATVAWLGEAEDITPEELDAIREEVSAYTAGLDGPIVAPVTSVGPLGDDGAEVAFLEPTEPLVAMRDGLLAASPTLSAVMARVEQFPEWTPHVTLSYPDRPARAEYSGTEVSFGGVGLWVRSDRQDFPMGNGSITADAAAVIADVPDEDEVDDIDEPDEIPVHGVLAPEGVETGDGRGFRPGSLSTRKLPIPLRLEIVGTHGGNTSEVVTVGRVDEAWRDEATGMWRFRGAIIMSKPHADQAIAGIIDGSGTGVSIDADSMAVDMSDFVDESGQPKEGQKLNPAAMREPTTWFSESRVAGLTIVPIPAFEEAYAGLGHEFAEDMTEEQLAASAAALHDCGCDSGEIDDEALTADAAFAPGTKDGPGWITHPRETSRIRNYWTRGEGAAKIAWGTPGDFNRCRRALAKYVQNPEWLAGLCANMHKEATGVWPGQDNGGRRGRHALIASGDFEAAPILTLIAAAKVEREVYPDEWFENPRFNQVTSLHVDMETRRVWGHLAQWNSCHIGIAGVCQSPPRSASSYAHFMKGVVDTTKGERRVGVLTYGIGHADPNVRAAAATAHYDKTDAVIAYVATGEDAFGIWYAGVIPEDVSEERIRKFRAIGALSGDWRNDGHGLELVAAVAVNTPGFPITALAASGGVQTSLIAAGVVPPEENLAESEDAFFGRAVEKAIEVIENRNRAAALRARVTQLRSRELRERIAKGI